MAADLQTDPGDYTNGRAVMTTNNSDSTFVRRKFTITETLDDVLTKLAAQNYQGNVSLCLRAAIEDHKATLQGTGAEQLATQRLAVKLENIEEQQEVIRAKLESLQGQAETRDQAEHGRCLGRSSRLTDGMHSIYMEMKTADNALRIDDLIERLDMPPSRLQPALGSLVDLGLVVEIGENTQRFRLAGHMANSFESERP